MSEVITFNTEKAVEHGLKQNLNQGPKAPIFKLVPETDPILKEVMPEFDFTNAPVNPNEFASSMVETCIQNKGYGLSANQCGFRYRMFVMGAGDDYVAFFNPKVTSYSTKDTHMMEGCLSFPFLGLMITRPEEIHVEYQDFNGQKKTATFNGISARCFLHELDHMNGVVYTSRVKPLALQSGMKKRNKVKQLIEKAKKAGALIEKATT